ncbi:hypothetical protein TNCV_2255291 [Trichonephila clavipes]|nr:hypothetical protein TNCV_2255291 [Trichonephila clavipes]
MDDFSLPVVTSQISGHALCLGGAARTLNKAERNYTIMERECLVVIWALKKFRTYFGALQELNIEWEHRPGVQNVVANVLSRNPVDNVDGSQVSCAAL